MFGLTMSEQTDDETPDSTVTDSEVAGRTGEGPRAELERTKERLEAEAGRAVSEFDEGIVDLLAWLLDTETRARIYVYLRQHPHSTSDEIAEGTGLYPSTVREALADLHDEDTVRREKRDSDSAGNNPYEYEAIAPSNLVRGVVGEVQRELNTVFTLEGALGDGEGDDGPVTITVDGDDEPDDTGSDADDGDDAVDIEIDDAESEDDA
jgi:predicted transcriptional regulator